MTNRRGIILAGGSGSRLHPAILAISKQLLPVFDKSVIYYPLSTLMLAGFRDILIISTPQDTPPFEQLLGDGGQWVLNLRYAFRPNPDGLAQAVLMGETLIGNQSSALVLGDNVFCGHGFHHLLANAVARTDGASVFAYHGHHPERHRVAEFDAQGRVLSLEEKSGQPKSTYAVTGLYFCDEQAVDMAKASNPRRLANRRLPTSTGCIWNRANSAFRSLAGAMPGWMPAPTNPCSMPASSLPLGKTAKASKWSARKKSPFGRVGSTPGDLKRWPNT